MLDLENLGMQHDLDILDSPGSILFVSAEQRDCTGTKMPGSKVCKFQILPLMSNTAYHSASR